MRHRVSTASNSQRFTIKKTQQRAEDADATFTINLATTMTQEGIGIHNRAAVIKQDCAAAVCG